MNFLKFRAQNNLPILLIPIFLGLASFFVAVGPLPLNPLNVSWLAGWDPQQEYFGWAIYRNGPWHFPLGLNPNFGMEFGSSIVYSDSIPILAIIFKSFNEFLPNQFQYFGIWNLISFVGQALFAWMLLNLFIKEKWVLISASFLFLFAPPFLWKIGSSNSLISQFLILAGLYLVFSKKISRFNFSWVMLLVLAEAVHFYIFAMLGVLWFADILQRGWIAKTLNMRRALVQMAVSLIIISIFAWQFGYFAVGAGSTATGNYGLGAMNVLAPFNSSSWSYFIPAIPQTPFNYVLSNLILNNVEGMNYLGAGSLLTLLFAFVGILKNRSFPLSWFKKYPFIIVGLLGLSMLAVSNKVGIGPFNFTFPLPQSVISIASMFRASGRMFWPVYYMLILASLVIVYRSYKKSLVLPMIACCALLQVLDTKAQWSVEKNVLELNSKQIKKSPLVNHFWEAAGNKYSELIRVPAKNNLYDWAVFADYAASHKMATNSAFLARFDENKLNQLNQSLNAEISSGQYRSSGLYIIENGGVIPVLLTLDREKDLFARIDGFNVLAPGWKNCRECNSDSGFDEYLDLLNSLKKIKSFHFSDLDRDRAALILLSRGWGNPESWGTWSSGKEAQIILPVSNQGRGLLTLELRALISSNLPTQNIKININGQAYKEVVLSQGEANKVDLTIPQSLGKPGFIVLDFALPNAARPADLGITADDDRLLSIGLVSATWN